MSVSVLQQAKIQAQVLVPLVKAMQAELGEEQANAIVRKALRDLSSIRRRILAGEERGEHRKGDDIGVRDLRSRRRPRL